MQKVRLWHYCTSLIGMQVLENHYPCALVPPKKLYRKVWYEFAFINDLEVEGYSVIATDVVINYNCHSLCKMQRKQRKTLLHGPLSLPPLPQGALAWQITSHSTWCCMSSIVCKNQHQKRKCLLMRKIDTYAYQRHPAHTSKGACTLNTSIIQALHLAPPINAGVNK